MPKLRWSMVKSIRDAERLARDAALVIFSRRTPWWTLNPADVQEHPVSHTKCDPRGGELVHVVEVQQWFNEAKRAAPLGHYGPFGLRAFMAAYNGNVVLTESDVPDRPGDVGQPTCLMTWGEYHALLEASGEHPQRPDATLYVFHRNESGGEHAIARAAGSNAALQQIDPRLDLFRHSPSGFDWGFSGSGPAQSALAVLADFLGDPEEAQRHHQRFKVDVIASHMENAWQLTGREIREWYERRSGS